MKDSEKNDVSFLTKFLTNPLNVLILGLLSALVVLGFYFHQFNDELSGNQEHWGQFGDFVGGLLNPTFGFLALLTLVATLGMQVKEFRDSVTELKNSANALNKQNESLERQNFEASFFHMLKLHNDIVDAIDLHQSNGKVIKGRDCFRNFSNRLATSLGKYQNYNDFLIKYDNFYLGSEHEIGHYFRFLYQLVSFVDKSAVSDKKFYVNLIRAQLSSHELNLFFYNGLSSYGKDKFKPLIEKYALLKHLAIEGIEENLIRLYDAGAYGGVYPESRL